MSRVTGLVRVVCVGAVLGPTFFANVYQSTNALPNVFYEFLTGSLFASLLVPPLVGALDRKDMRGVARLAGGFLGVVMVVFATTAVLVVVAGPAVVALLGLGVADPVVLADQRRIGLLLLVLVMPQLLLYGLAGTAAAAMNARGRFALPAAAPALENLGIVATLLVFAGLGRAGLDIREITTSDVVVLGVGTTGAVALHAAAQWCGAYRGGITLLPRAGWRDPEVRTVLRAARPALGQSGLSAVRMLGLLVVASSIPGGVVAFLLAFSFFNLVTALTARPMATALLPRLARLHRAGDLTKFRAELDRSVSFVGFLAVPAACCLLLLSIPLSWAVTFGEMANPRGETLVAVSLAALSFGVLADAALIVLTATSYARQEPGLPFKATVLRIGLTVLGMGLTLVLADGTAVLLGLGLSMVLGDVVGALYLARRVLLTLPPGSAGTRAVAARGLMAGSFMGTAGLASAVAVRVALDGGVADVLAGLTAAASATAVFLLVHRLLRSPEMPLLLARAVRSR